MKLKSFFAVALGSVVTFAVVPSMVARSAAQPAVANSLQAGVYNAGSRYIHITEQNGRLCYQGFSANGAITASITSDAQQPGIYQINGTDAVLQQESTEVLLFGTPDNLLPYRLNSVMPSDLASELQDCLNFNQPYFFQQGGGRGSG